MTLTSTAEASPAPSSLRMTPGRWAALAVGVPVALALIGWTGFSLVGMVAKASYPFSYTVPVHDSQVTVTANLGNLTVRQTSGSTALLTGTVQYGLFRPGISESATPGSAFVGVNCDSLNSNCDSNATLYVPAKTAVTVSSGGGDIGVSGFASNMTLSAEGGNVTANNLAGDLRLDTGGGDLTGSGLSGTIQITAEGGNVEASNFDGPMRLDTGGGDLNATGLTGDLQVFTEGGNIDGYGVGSQQVFAQSSGGDVTLAFTRPPTNLQVTAEGGNVTVILPPGDTQYDISTPGNQGGSISYPRKLQNGASHNTITVDSGGGDVSIAQAS
jgi:Putative adhesin